MSFTQCSEYNSAEHRLGCHSCHLTHSNCFYSNLASTEHSLSCCCCKNVSQQIYVSSSSTFSVSSVLVQNAEFVSFTASSSNVESDVDSDTTTPFDFGAPKKYVFSNMYESRKDAQPISAVQSEINSRTNQNGAIVTSMKHAENSTSPNAGSYASKVKPTASPASQIVQEKKDDTPPTINTDASYAGSDTLSQVDAQSTKSQQTNNDSQTQQPLSKRAIKRKEQSKRLYATFYQEAKDQGMYREEARNYALQKRHEILQRLSKKAEDKKQKYLDSKSKYEQKCDQKKTRQESYKRNNMRNTRQQNNNYKAPYDRDTEQHLRNNYSQQYKAPLRGNASTFNWNNHQNFEGSNRRNTAQRNQQHNQSSATPNVTSFSRFRNNVKTHNRFRKVS